MLNFCDFIQVFVFTTNHHLKTKKPVKDLTCKTMIRPVMEFSSAVWDQTLQTQITALEQVQRRAARYVCIDFTSRTPGCVTKMLNDLNWEPLEVRHRHDRLSMLYKMQHNLVEVSTSQRQPHQRTSRELQTCLFQLLLSKNSAGLEPTCRRSSVCSVPRGIHVTPLDVIYSTTPDSSKVQQCK